MVALSEKEDGTLCYSFLLSDDRKHGRLVETYTDVAAITAQFKGRAMQELVPQLLKVASLSVMELYGDLGPEVASVVASFKPMAFPNWHGFDR